MKELNERLDDAMASTLKDGEVFMGWFVIAEVVTEDGERELRWMRSPGAYSWQVKGYIHEYLEADLAVEVNRVGGDD